MYYFYNINTEEGRKARHTFFRLALFTLLFLSTLSYSNFEQRLTIFNSFLKKNILLRFIRHYTIHGNFDFIIPQDQANHNQLLGFIPK